MADRFDKFSPRAVRALQTAQEEAQAHDLATICAEHLLIGVLQDTSSAANAALTSLHVDLAALTEAARAAAPSSADASAGDIGLGPYARRTIERAVDEVRAQRHSQVDTEHVLLGLFASGSPSIAELCKANGVHLTDARAAVMEALGRRPLHQIFGTTAPAAKPAVAALGEQQATVETGPVTLITRRLTRDARLALEQASLTARWYFESEITPRHLLIGLLRVRSSAAAVVLGECGLAPRQLLRHLRADWRRTRRESRAGYSADAKAILMRAIALAEVHQHPRAATAHVLQCALDDASCRTLLLSARVDIESLTAQLAPLLVSDTD